MRVRKLAWLAVFVLSLVMCFSGIEKLKASCPTVSYRFLQPFKIPKAEGKANLATAYWSQHSSIINAEYKSCNAFAIGVLGSPFLCYPMAFLNGGFNGEPFACAISDSLAFKLFNSTDIVGLTVKTQNTNYTVKGVFKDKSDIIVYTALKTDNFNNIEIEADHKQADSFLLSHGLKAADNVVDGQVLLFVFSLALYLPLLTAAFIFIARSFKAAQNKEQFIFILLIITACTLPLILNILPDFLVPSKWSDFSFYSTLYENAKSALKQWLLLPPFLKDLAAKYAMLQCSLSSLAATVACINFLKI